MIKYLDERIINTTTLSPSILRDGLYRYDVTIDDEWDDPVFVGNCFIKADTSSKTIDITDIVRNFYDFNYPYDDTDFQREWQVRIWQDEYEQHINYSNQIGIYPIYRYPNRKASLETPLSNNMVDWIQPALQGFDSDHKGEFLPHIPFVYSNKVDYNLALNCGNVDNITPYLYTGVNKTLQLNNYGIYNTSYKLSELWTGSEVETLDWNWKYITANQSYEDNIVVLDSFIFMSLSPLHYSCKIKVAPKQIRYGTDESDIYNVEQIEEFPFVADLQKDLIYGGYFDLYIEQEEDTNYVDVYPQVIKDTTVKAHIVVDYQPVTDIALVEAVEGGTKSGNFVTVTTNETTFNVVAEDADGGDVREETGLVTGKTFEWNDTEGIKTIKITASSGIVCTITLADKSTAETGAEYLMQLQVAAGNLILSFLDQQYDVDVTFRTYQKQAAPLTQSNITIQNDGTDNLTSSDAIRFIQNNQTIAVVTGEQTIDDATVIRKLIISALTKPSLSYAVVNKGVLVYAGADIMSSQVPNSIGFQEGDFELYIFATSGSDLEVTKITTKDFGIAKSFTAILNVEKTRIGLLDWNAVTADSQKYKDYIASKNIIEVAKVDTCPARYYLQWRDRYGSMQMQPFSKVDTYSEDFTRTEIKNYQDTRRLSNISIQPKWTLNTGWLNNIVYPYYESLFVSPWLKLYDVQEDNIYDVIITDNNYTEKTFKNQSRSLFNLQLNLEATDKQNILY